MITNRSYLTRGKKPTEVNGTVKRGDNEPTMKTPVISLHPNTCPEQKHGLLPRQKQGHPSLSIGRAQRREIPFRLPGERRGHDDGDERGRETGGDSPGLGEGFGPFATAPKNNKVDLMPELCLNVGFVQLGQLDKALSLVVD
jgi:hypothetical protein